MKFTFKFPVKGSYFFQHDCAYKTLNDNSNTSLPTYSSSK